jgi:hypothetical protein
MAAMMSVEECGVSWCQVSQPHDRHEQVLVTIHCHLLGSSQQGRTVQFGVTGFDELTAMPALTVIRPNGLAQESVELFWEDALRIGPQLESAWGRFRP